MIKPARGAQSIIQYLPLPNDFEYRFNIEAVAAHDIKTSGITSQFAIEIMANKMLRLCGLA